MIILADGLIPFLLHLESYLVYEKVGHCNQLRLLLIHLLLSIPGSRPQDDVKPFLSQFLQECHQQLHAKKGTGLWVEYDNQ